MTLLYYYFFINKDVLESMLKNILCSKSVWKVLTNIIHWLISLIAVPLSCYWFLIYLNNWTAISLVSSEIIENKVMQFMLKCFFVISFIDIVSLVIISALGTATLAFIIMARYFDELFDRKSQIKSR